MLVYVSTTCLCVVTEQPVGFLHCPLESGVGMNVLEALVVLLERSDVTVDKYPQLKSLSTRVS